MAMALEQEHVVVVEVRADTAAIAAMTLWQAAGGGWGR